MSEFADRHGRILTGRDRRFAHRMDGLTSREIRKGERLEKRALARVPLPCRRCAGVRTCRFEFDPEECGES